MPTKVELYSQLASDTARRLTGNWERWADFLSLAGRLYKYPYPDQLMIYAQRPDATACAEYDIWNNRMNRYVRRGSKGIALLDDNSQRLRYVFDVSDTGTRRNSLDPDQWRMTYEFRQPVAEMLEKTYGVSDPNFAQQLANLSGRLVEDYWDNNSRDVLDIVDGSLLEGYDDLSIEMEFKSAGAASITYLLLSRCGIEPDGWFDRDDFAAIYSFDTPAAVGVLGTAVSDSCRQVLRQIERTIKTTIRRRNIEMERSAEHEQLDLFSERGLSHPEPDPRPGPGPTSGQVRADAPDLPQAEPAGAVQPDASGRDPVLAPAGGGRDRPGPSGTDDAPAGEGRRRDGAAEGPRPDAVGRPDEHLQGPGRGNPDGGTHQQLSFFLSEAEQIEQIDQRAETEKVSAFSFSSEDIALALASGSGFAHGKERIAAYFEEEHTPKERAEFLKKEYGTGGRSWTFLDGSSGFLDYDSKGIKLRSYPTGQEQRLKWPEVEKRIHILIAAGKYLDEPSKEEPIWEYNGVKERHPDDLILYQMGDFFELYGEDARTAAAELGIQVHSRAIPGGGRVGMCGVPADQLEQIVEQLRNKHNVTISAVPKNGGERQEYSLRSIDHKAEQAIDTHEAEFGADGVRAFPDGETGKAATLRELHEQYKPIVLEAVNQDTRYGNVCSDGDRERAVIEGRAAVQRAVLSSGNQELLHLYSHIPEFRQRLTREVIDETYPKLHELLRPLSDADIDKAIQAWNGNIESKHTVVRYMEKHGREKDTAAWLAHEFDGGEGRTPFTVRPDSPKGTVLPWPKVQRRIAQLIKEDRFYTEAEQDRFDNIDPIAIREALAARGIADGQVVDPEKLDNDPFIRQVMADVEAVAAAEVPEPSHARDPLAPAYREGDQVFLEGSPYEITRVDTYHVELLPPGLRYPVFREEPKERFEHLLRQDERNAHITDFLAEPLASIDADIREALTTEGGLLDATGWETLSEMFRAGQGNRQIAQHLAQTYSGFADIVELTGGELADCFGSEAGLELNINDKYETKVTRTWEEVAQTLRTIYQLGQDGFAQKANQPEPVQAEPDTEKPANEEAPKPLTAEDVTDIRLESSSYSAVSREKEYRLSCKINGVPDTLIYTVSQHDDGEGFTIQSSQRGADDIWKKMSEPELEKLETVLSQAVKFDYWSKSIEHAADADALEVVALDYRWAEDLDLSDEQRDDLWNQIEARRVQLTVQPDFTAEPVTAYPAEETHLPYDIVIEKLHIERPEHEISTPAARNFHIRDDHLGEGGPKEKFWRNIKAIATLKQIEQENRQATLEEQHILSQYVGWGGLPDAFDPDKASWAAEYSELKGLLTPEEYAAARASTLNAHYTSPTVIRAIYKAVEQMGFKTGNILEPSCGVGNFFGMLPESMAGSKLYGVELDSITGRIAQKLYPEATITVAGFETTSQRDFYDLAVGNVPFGNYKVNDKAYNNLGFSIHNYFFAKALDQVRPGGVIAFVTSRYTLDSKDSSARKHLAERADLLGAIRLPNNAFRANAGTEVVSDIIFLQKRDRPIDREPDWVQLNKTPEGFTINQYFVEHPEMVLGELSTENTQYGREDITVHPFEGADLAAQLKEATAKIHGEYRAVQHTKAERAEDAPNILPADPGVKNFSYTIVDGEVYYRENSIMTQAELSGDARERVKGMVELRRVVNELIQYQLEDYPDADIQAKQAELNTAYDAFAAKFGLINDRKNGRLFEDDSSYYLLCSLENLDENGKLKSKADMFTKRTIRPEHSVTHVDTPAEALAVSIGERGRVDLPYMSELLGTPGDYERITSDLQGVIFKDPSADATDPEVGWQTADEYLSGNVRNKLRIAQLAVQTNPEFAPNVEALTKAQPKELEASEIDVRLGATWLDPKVIQQFTLETFQVPFYLRHAVQVKFSPATAEWRIEGKTKTGFNDVAAYETFGTKRANGYKILEDTLNLRDVRVYDTIEEADGSKKRVLNKKETTLAQQKQQVIKDAFGNWVWKDPQRRETLVKQYNELFNTTRPREYDGSHIHFVGMNPEIKLREHQRNAIAHVLYGGNTLLAHEVGAGKTFEMAASAMEAKRLGLCQKSLFVVPNHLTLQWAQEFLHLYPSAKLLVASKKDFETANRKKFCARIATGDYDAVIIGHSQFEKIPLSFERQERIIQDQIDEIQNAIAELKAGAGERFTVKQMEKSRKQLEAKLEKLKATERKDDVVTFEELGVDRLFVDESHAFKNLFLYTKMRNVAGLSTSEAQKSSDMFGKCRYMDELTGGRGVVFATGTPVSNSMSELYTVMRYLQYGTLQQKGLTHFDCWASTFGETTTSIELAPEGTGYRARTRFAKFFNLPELMTIFKEVADIKTSDQLHLPVPEAKFETVLVKPSEIQKEMVQSLSERAGKINAGKVDPSEDNMLCITNDGRKIGLDQRLMNPMLPDDPGSKVNACVGNVLRIWEEGKEQRLTQLLFCDLSTPKGDGQFNIYDDVKKKLLAAGVPESEVAFIHTADTEAKKKELFSKVRAGQVRILLGSTSKMGAGTNVQDRLVAVHHLDVGWKPSDMTQRNGRIIRQGNRNKEVQVYNYVTEGTFDAYLYQTLENKQRFIGQIMTSKSPVRSCEDVDEQVLSYAEVKALCAGNPLIKEKMNLDVEVAKLKVLKADHQSQRYRLEDRLLKDFPASIQYKQSEIAALRQDAETAKAHPQGKEFCGIEIRGMHFDDKLAAGERLLTACQEMPSAEAVTLGNYRGFGLDLQFDSFRNEYQAILRGETSHFVSLGTDARGNLTRIDNALDNLPERVEQAENALQALYQQRDAAQAELEKPFPQEEELAAKSARLAELDSLLNMDAHPEPEQDVAESESGQKQKSSVLAELKAAAAEKPTSYKQHKKEAQER